MDLFLPSLRFVESSTSQLWRFDQNDFDLVGDLIHTTSNTFTVVVIVIESDCIVQIGRLPVLNVHWAPFTLTAGRLAERKSRNYQFSLSSSTHTHTLDEMKQYGEITQDLLFAFNWIDWSGEGRDFLCGFEVRRFARHLCMGEPSTTVCACVCLCSRARSLQMWWQLNAFQPNENHENYLITPERSSFVSFYVFFCVFSCTRRANLGHSQPQRPSAVFVSLTLSQVISPDSSLTLSSRWCKRDNSGHNWCAWAVNQSKLNGINSQRTGIRQNQAQWEKGVEIRCSSCECERGDHVDRKTLAVTGHRDDNDKRCLCKATSRRCCGYELLENCGNCPSPKWYNSEWMRIIKQWSWTKAQPNKYEILLFRRN